MKIFLLSAAGVAVFGSSPAYSALLLTDFTITTTAVSFDITGTIDNSATIGPTGQFQLYLGVPGDTDWITSNTFSPTVANNGGANSSIQDGSGLSGDNVNGDFLSIQKTGAPTSAWAVGDSVNASVTFAGTYIPANLNVADLIISAGTDGTITQARPDVNFQVGAAVPEPSSTMLTLGCLGFGILCRRR